MLGNYFSFSWTFYNFPAPHHWKLDFYSLKLTWFWLSSSFFSSSFCSFHLHWNQTNRWSLFLFFSFLFWIQLHSHCCCCSLFSSSYFSYSSSCRECVDMSRSSLSD